jgi:hypothetical protein
LERQNQELQRKLAAAAATAERRASSTTGPVVDTANK